MKLLAMSTRYVGVDMNLISSGKTDGEQWHRIIAVTKAIKITNLHSRKNSRSSLVFQGTNVNPTYTEASGKSLAIKMVTNR